MIQLTTLIENHVRIERNGIGGRGVPSFVRIQDFLRSIDVLRLVMRYILRILAAVNAAAAQPWVNTRFKT